MKTGLSLLLFLVATEAACDPGYGRVTTRPASQPATSQPVDPVFALDAARAAADSAKAAARDALAKRSPEYASIRENLPKLRDALEAARGGDDVKTRLAASKALNDAKAKMEHLEAAAFASDPEVAAAQSNLDAASRSRARAQAAQATRADQAAKEEKRRAASLEAAHRPMADLNVGTVGMLDEITIVQVLDERRMLVRVDNNHPLVMVEGISTAGAADGQTKAIRVPMEISGTTTYQTVLGAKKTVVVATPFVPR